MKRNNLAGLFLAATGASALAAALLQGCAVGNRVEGSAAFDPKSGTALFYSDLGPDSIDVSGYPEEQKKKYAVYARTCSQCHTLARSINMPTVSRGFWEFYVTGMRLRSKITPDTQITKEDAQAIVDFLEYDSAVRKVRNKKEFERTSDDLKRRFDPIIQERMRRIQEQKQPKFLPPD